MEAIFFIVLLLFFIANLGTDYFNHKWFVFTLGAITLLSYHVYLKSGPMLMATLFYMMTSSAYYSINAIGKHAARAKYNPLFESAMYRSLLATMSFSSLFVLMDFTMVEACFAALPFVMSLSVIYNLLPLRYRAVKSHKGKLVSMYGFGGNSSVDATFRSLAGILCLHWYDSYPLAIGIFTALNFLAVIRNKASAGLGGYIAGLLCYFGIFKDIYWAFAVFAAAVPALVFYYGKKHSATGSGRLVWSVFCPSGREWIIPYMWKALTRVWPNKWTGNGLGSFLNMAHTVQIAKKDLFQGGVFLWLHCDAVQAIIEGGYIFGVLVIAAMVEANFGLNPIVLSYTCCYIVNSLANFPNHMAPDQFMNLLALKLAYNQ